MGFGLSLLVEVLGGVVTAALLASLVATREAKNRDDAAEHEATDLNEDLRRFLRDRDRTLGIEMAVRSGEMNARGLFHSGAHLVALRELKRQALQEYRDEATIKRRRYRELCQERFACPFVLRRRTLPVLRLTAESREILAGWRIQVQVAGMTDAVPMYDHDPTNVEREPHLRNFEERGDHCD
jgi:hypothetical protein